MESRNHKTTRKSKPTVRQINKALSNKQKPKTKAVTVKSTFEEKKGIILRDARDIYSADKMLKDFTEASRSKSARGELIKKLGNTLIAFELNTHFALAETTSEGYRTLAVEFCKKLIQEYNCKTPSEKALAEIIAGAFVRQFRCAKRLEYCIGGSLSPGGAVFISAIGKELDRATRTFLIALTTLKQIKNSPVKLNVKATTAFIAQNQQINATNNRGVDKNENIESK